MAVDSYARQLAVAALNNGSGGGGQSDDKTGVNYIDLDGAIYNRDNPFLWGWEEIEIGEVFRIKNSPYIKFKYQGEPVGAMGMIRNNSGDNIAASGLYIVTGKSQKGFLLELLNSDKYTGMNYDIYVYGWLSIQLYDDPTKGLFNIIGNCKSYYSYLTTMLNTGSNYTITGKYTFNSLPETSIAPTNNNQFVNKVYVDNAISNAIATNITSALESDY